MARTRGLAGLAAGLCVLVCAGGDDVTIQIPTDRDLVEGEAGAEGSGGQTEAFLGSDTMPGQPSGSQGHGDQPDSQGYGNRPSGSPDQQDQPSGSQDQMPPDRPREQDSSLQEPELRITISAAGDMILGSYYGQGYAGSFPETYKQEKDPGYFLENVYSIFSQDDLTLVNLEGPLTSAREGEGKEKTYCIKGEPEYASILTEGSVEAVSMGNNHRLDYYEKGSRDTVAAMEEAGIVYAYDSNTGIYETQGIRIGLISVDIVSQGSGVEKYVQEGIASLQEEEVDLLIACCHWGIEGEHYPEAYQRSLGQKCIDWGADLVIGHHPHVLQGIEEYQGKYIVYSLGNFCFGANRNPVDKDTMIFQQTFVFVDGIRQEEAPVQVIPCSVSSLKERNDYRPTPAQGEEAERILQRINTYSRELGAAFDTEGYLVRE